MLDFKDGEIAVIVNATYVSDYTPVNINSDKVADDKKLNEIVFNPFQRGNGCTLAGYTLKEVLAHTR